MSSQNSDPILIRLQGIQKSFLSDELETRALDEIQLQIRRGEFLAVSGPSGCGKSSLLAILGLLDSPSAGSYELDGQRVERLDNRARALLRNRSIGFVFQAFNLIAELTVEENVALPLSYRKEMSRAQRRSRVAEVLAQVDMSHRARHYPNQLSGGQQQRVAIARALVGRPSLILADEPTGNLDSRNAELVMQLLKDVHAAGATLCMVTHEPRFAAMAQRSISLYDGHIVADLPTADRAAPQMSGQAAEVI
ncbi:putative ABC transport system ATP-binding protein [Paucibacter oligotrophus]|uniref:Putative ABC transport system ATP-binding protein n=1 Tax=Roseateles oligotrophus TaxID=1769250 RepID=A0A840L5U4_9BURK|nr:ABC transporter ATP-binding protein [Roseateles oligotrophus]MBB4843934.1 putative ABC transport system ATP-binding protein [Roseateles oligotrophus]